MKFQKGQSGNPGGRPKDSHDVAELARTYTKEATERLVFWMRSDDPRASVAASEKLLDRGHGKPAQSATIALTGEGGGPLTVVHKHVTVAA